MKFIYTAQPTGTDIVSLVDLKQFLRVDSADEDATILALLDAAIRSIQDYTGLHFKDTTWLYSMQYMTNVTMPYGVSTVTGVSYFNTAGESTVLDTADYYWGFANGIMKVKYINIPTDIIDNKIDAVNIIGGVVNQINPALTHAVKMLAAHFYENRRAVVVGASTSIMPLGIEAIINPYRIIYLK